MLFRSSSPSTPHRKTNRMPPGRRASLRGGSRRRRVPLARARSRTPRASHAGRPATAFRRRPRVARREWSSAACTWGSARAAARARRTAARPRTRGRAGPPRSAHHSRSCSWAAVPADARRPPRSVTASRARDSPGGWRARRGEAPVYRARRPPGTHTDAGTGTSDANGTVGSTSSGDAGVHRRLPSRRRDRPPRPRERRLMADGDEEMAAPEGTAARRRKALERWVPGARLARTYDRSWLRSDVVAGIVLAAILVPQGMAYAELAGLPAVTGLYTTIACLLGYALFGPSRVLVLGPDSSISPLILAAITPLLAGGDAGNRDRAGRDAGRPRRAHRDRARAREARLRRRPALQGGAGRVHERPGDHHHRRPAAEALRVLHRRRRFLDEVNAFVQGLDQTDATTLDRRALRPRRPARAAPLDQAAYPPSSWPWSGRRSSRRSSAWPTRASRPSAPCPRACRRRSCPGPRPATSGRSSSRRSASPSSP